MDEKDIDRVIEMAWEDRTPFEAIKAQFGLAEANVIALMRKELKRSSFNLWRKRVNSGVSQKHLYKRNSDIDRFKCSLQKPSAWIKLASVKFIHWIIITPKTNNNYDATFKRNLLLTAYLPRTFIYNFQ